MTVYRVSRYRDQQPLLRIDGPNASGDQSPSSERACVEEPRADRRATSQWIKRQRRACVEAPRTGWEAQVIEESFVMTSTGANAPGTMFPSATHRRPDTGDCETVARCLDVSAMGRIKLPRCGHVRRVDWRTSAGPAFPVNVVGPQDKRWPARQEPSL